MMSQVLVMEDEAVIIRMIRAQRGLVKRARQ